MKKTIVLAVLGLAAGVASSFGQGAIVFNTYAANNSYGLFTTYGAGVTGQTAGANVDSSFTGALLYSLTPINDAASTAGTASDPLNAGWTMGVGSDGTTLVEGTYGNTLVPGTVKAPVNLYIPTYSSGVVYFEWIAFNGADYASSTIRGHSASFSMPLATGQTLPWVADGAAGNGGSGLISGFSVYNVNPVPEPGTLALAGLGGLGMLMAFRRKKA